METPVAQFDLTRSAARWILAAILLLAALLRLLHLDHESLWFDEAVTVASATAPLRDVVKTVIQLENMPPLYFLLMNGWVRIFGASDFSLRLPSALCGIASVGMIYLLARRLAPRRMPETVGLAAAALLAISRYHIAYCQQARCYSLLILLCLFYCHTLVELLAGEKSPRLPMVLVASGAAILWTQPFGALILLAGNIFFLLLWFARQNQIPPLRSWLTWQAIIILLFSPWLGKMMNVIQIGAPWILPPKFGDAALSYADTWPMAALLGIFILIALWRGWTQRDPNVLLALLLAVLPVATPILASTPSHPMFVPRYGIAALIGIYLLAARGIAAFGQAGAAVAMLSVCVLASPNLIHDLQRGTNAWPRADLRDAAAAVTRLASPGDAVFCVDAMDARVFYLYCTRGDLVRMTKMPAAAAQRLWLVASQTDAHGMEPAAQQDGFRPVSRKNYPGICVVEWRPRAAPQAR